jgi:ribosome-associated translation inhibitor RaiA
MTTQELGGNISLTGFSDRDFTEMIVIKKIVGQYARKFSDSFPGFSRLSMTLKEVHHTAEGHGKFELVAKAQLDGQEYGAEAVNHNLFVALDDSLKHLMQQMQKHQEKLQQH